MLGESHGTDSPLVTGMGGWEYTSHRCGRIEGNRLIITPPYHQGIVPPHPLFQLSDRFLRLLLQLSKRYSTWVGQVLASRTATPPDQQQQQQQLQTSTSEGGGALSPESAALGPPAWASQMPLEDLAVFMRDLQVWRSDWQV